MPLFKVTTVCETFVVAEDPDQAMELVDSLFIDVDPEDKLNPIVKAIKVNRSDLTKKDFNKDIVATEEMSEKSGVFSDYLTVGDYFKIKDAVA